MKVILLKTNRLFLALSLVLILGSTIKAQVNVSIPDITKASVVPDEYIPIIIGDITGKNVTSFQFNLFYNKNIVYITDITSTGSELTGISNPIFNADTANGVLRVAWASAYPLSGSGVLVKFKLKYRGDGYSNLTFTDPATSQNSFRLNGGNPTVTTKNGSVTIGNVQFSFSLSGQVTYYNSNNGPIQNVQVTITGQTGTYNTTTDTNGNYSFSDLTPGTYSLAANKNDGWGGVNSTDALLTARYFVHMSSLDQIQQLAADVNNNNIINSTDALLIAKRFSGSIQSFSKPDWIFTPDSINIQIVNSNVIQNLTGIAAGDVNRSFNP